MYVFDLLWCVTISSLRSSTVFCACCAIERNLSAAFVLAIASMWYNAPQVTVDDHTTVKFDIWDTAGQERFRSISALFYRGSAAAIIVYDITDMKSFDTARKYWLGQLKTHAVRDCIIVFAGTLWCVLMCLRGDPAWFGVSGVTRCR